MATVHIPSGLLHHTGGLERLTIEASRVDELIREIARRFPALAGSLEQMAVAIDGQIYHAPGYQPLASDSEVHFVPPIGGG